MYHIENIFSTAFEQRNRRGELLSVLVTRATSDTTCHYLLIQMVSKIDRRLVDPNRIFHFSSTSREVQSKVIKKTVGSANTFIYIFKLLIYFLCSDITINISRKIHRAIELFTSNKQHILPAVIKSIC